MYVFKHSMWQVVNFTTRDQIGPNLLEDLYKSYYHLILKLLLWKYTKIFT